MKRATSIMAVLLTAVIFSTTMNGCKKGENDPMISFKGRDGRITGIWKLMTTEGTDTDISSFSGLTSTTVTTTSYNGSIRTVTSSSSGLATVTATSYTEEITIEKDGTYSMTSVSDGATWTATGYWWWLDGKKNKVRIAFDDDSNSFYIDQLKNKEMILKYDAYSRSTASDGDFSESTETSLSTYTKS